jgi:hypothetical protein
VIAIMTRTRSFGPAALLLLLGVSLCAADTNFTIRFGDKFGDGWNGAQLSYLKMDYNSSYQVMESDFMELGDENRAAPDAGVGVVEGQVSCDDGEAVYFALVYGENHTFLVNHGEPVQSWEIYFQVEVEGTVYHGGWNTFLGITCGNSTYENVTVIDWTENLLEPLTDCPECAHPKPKPKPKPKHRRLGADDDRKGKPKPPLKYWPFPVKLIDPTDRDGWFIPDTFAYAEYTISDASRMNLLAEGTLCEARGSDGHKTVCENTLPDGHYIFRASGNLDEFSANYTWQLCGKNVMKYMDDDSSSKSKDDDSSMTHKLSKDDDMSSKDDDDKNKTKAMTYDGATGGMGNEVSFTIKKGKCIVDEVVTVDDYVNGTALDTVLTLDGHILLENAHFDSLSPVEGSFLEADINEFVSLDIEKTVSITSVEDVNDGTLVGYRIVAAHAESQLMHGTMDHVIEEATEQLQTQLSGGGFLSFLRNNLQNAGLSDDKLMSVESASFVDLDFENLVTLRDGETMSGDVVAGGNHFAVTNPVVSGDVTSSSDSSRSNLMLDVLTASGAFALVAVIVVVVIVTLKPPAETSVELDNSSANLVKPDVDESSDNLDASSNDLLPSASTPDSTFSYEESLSAALTQRWEMNADESVRL